MIGRVVSHYRILSELGAGGMGVVYLAEDLSLGRQVAVKFLPPHLSGDPEARQRLLHEAKAAAALDHPNICTVHEVGEADGQLFLVMAHVEGEALRERIATGPLPLPQALALAAEVADGLHEAHGKGVVHRDVKPANVMLTPKGQAKVMDFGLAHLAGASRVTRSGSTLGTAAYMSPEQARGEDVDRRTDIWSLGVVLYEMVSGRRPFRGEHEAALLYGIQHADPEPLTALRTGVPPRLDEIVGKCLAKDPGQRYQHADDLAVDLRRLHTELGTGRLAARAKAGPWSRPVPARAAALALLLALVAGGAWAVLRHRGEQPTAEAALAVVDFEDLGGGSDSLSAAGLSGLLQVGLIERSPVRVVSPEYLQDLRRRTFAGARGPIKPDQALEVARKSGATLLLSGQIGRSGPSTFAVWRLVETRDGRGVGGQRVVQADLLGLADGIIAAVVPLVAGQARLPASADTGSVGRITTASPEAYREFVAGQMSLSPAEEDKALRHFEAATQLDSTFALAWARQADIHWSRTRFALAKACADKAWSLRARLGIKDRMMLESRRLSVDQKMTAAMDVYREMLARWPDDRLVLGTYASALEWHWQVLEAQTVAEQGLARYPDDEELGQTLVFALLGRGKDREALAAADEYRRRHPATARAWDLIGEASLAAGEADSAEAALRRARTLEPDDVLLQTDLARCAAVRGQVAEALAILERLLARSDLSAYQRTRIMRGTSGQPALATLCAARGQLRRALQWIEVSRRVSNPSESDAGLAFYAQARILLDMGQPREAIQSAREITRLGTLSSTHRWAWEIRVRALIQLDSLAVARESLARFLAEKDRFAGYAHQIPLSIAAGLALAEDHPDTALAKLAKLSEYGRLSDSDQETRARALRALHRLPEAAATLESLLKHNGSRYIARYQLGQLYEEMGRPQDAAREYDAFLEAWADADPGWPQVDDARCRLAALRAAS